MGSDFEDMQARAVRASVFRRLIPFLVLCLIVHVIDRMNVGFAALTMNKELGLTATAFGFATTLYSAAYLLAEIPSNVMMAKLGARIWISRIMITWGLAAAGTALVVGPNSFNLSRVLLGISEAGFMPGVFLYLSYWIPASDRARATSIFLLAQPVGGVVASFLSGPMLAMDGMLGLSGWRWLLLLQGLPAIPLGFAAFLYLPDGPRQAKWLSDEEKKVLEGTLAESHIAEEASHWQVVLQLLSDRKILLLGGAYFGLASSLTAYGVWSPLITRAVLPQTNLALLAALLALPPLAAVITMIFWGRNSDLLEERTWHTIVPTVMAACGWLLLAIGGEPIVRFVGLTATLTGCFAAQGIFWTIVALRLPSEHRPVGIAMVSCFGLLGGTFSPLIFGWFADRTGDLKGGLFVLAALLLMSAVCVFAARNVDFPVMPSVRKNRYQT